MLSYIYQCAHAAKGILEKKEILADVCILGTHQDEDLRLFCKNLMYESEFPDIDENDLIQRYLFAAKARRATHIIRLTADCWNHSPLLIAEVAEALKHFDYVSNTIDRTFLEGLDTQGCSLEALKWFDANQTENREHPFFDFEKNITVRSNFIKKFKFLSLLNPQNRWLIKGSSVDTAEDLELANKIYDENKKARSNLVLASS